MASFSMHLAIAKLYLQKHEEEDVEEFIKGTLDPDMVPSNEKGRTHYGLHAAWSNPAKYLLENGKSIENSYKKGYFLHLLTDYLFYHKLVDIDKFVTTSGVEKILNDQQIDDLKIKEWQKNQRNDFGILEGEIVEKYEIEDLINKLPDKLKEVMERKQGELKVFERESLFKFLEDMAKVDLNQVTKTLLKNPESDLIKLFEECISSQHQGEAR